MVAHESLQPGDACPSCGKGTVYETGRPGVLVRLVGQAPIQAKVYELQKLHCNLCGEVFTASAPQGVGAEKYDATSGSMIALLKYGSGMPFNRSEGLQGSLGIPLPASTQWEIVWAKAKRIAPAYEELVCQAAQGEVVYNDDTTVKILELMGARAKEQALEEEAADDSAKQEVPKRRGLFTSGVVSTRDGRRVALFFSGRKHAGENLKDVLVRRVETLDAPIQMCDALSCNLPGELQTILAHCLAHGRRRFVEVADRFPEECRYVLESLAVIYRNDAVARERKLSPSARRHFHQARERPGNGGIACLAASPVGRSAGGTKLLVGHGDFLHAETLGTADIVSARARAPLDNNICERVLKRAILHRKNALFFKTSRGAHVGDLFMSLIHTCQLCGANPFQYLTEVDCHADELSSNPDRWMPWNYQETLAAAPTAPAAC